MIKTKSLLILIFSLLFSNYYLSFSQELTITTYYPSPVGIYKELRAKRMAIGDSFYDPSHYCWEGSCTVSVDSDADLIVEGKVGIGIEEPLEKLDVDGNTKIRENLEVIGKVEIGGTTEEEVSLYVNKERHDWNAPEISGIQVRAVSDSGQIGGVAGIKIYAEAQDWNFAGGNPPAYGLLVNAKGRAWAPAVGAKIEVNSEATPPTGIEIYNTGGIGSGLARGMYIDISGPSETRGLEIYDHSSTWDNIALYIRNIDFRSGTGIKVEVDSSALGWGNPLVAGIDISTNAQPHVKAHPKIYGIRSIVSGKGTEIYGVYSEVEDKDAYSGYFTGGKGVKIEGDLTVANCLVFKNNFKVVGAEEEDALYFLNQKGEKIMKLDKDGNLFVKGEIKKNFDFEE